MKKFFFVRGDDVTGPGRLFLAVFNFLAAEKVPAVYAVIPAAVKPGLRRLLAAHPQAGELFEVVQHGLSHKDRSGNRFLRQEFGPVRPFARQLADIRAGRDLMKKNFGRLFVPAFVPPFHMYNSATVEAAGKAGLKAFSASKKVGAFPEGGPVFLRAEVNVNEYGLDLKPRPLVLAALKKKTLVALRLPGPATGVYFHHADLRSRDFKVFRDYVAFLKDLAGLGLIELALFSTILNSRKK